VLHVNPKKLFASAVTATGVLLSGGAADADENLLGYVKGAETLPEGAYELYNWVTVRSDKGKGHYTAVNTKTELEYGLTNRFSVSGAFKTQSIDTYGLIVDGYLPGPKDYVLRPSGAEIGGKYNVLRPAIDPVGLATYFSIDTNWLDPHSGQDKFTLSADLDFLFQKYFLDARLIWVGNLGMETTYAARSDIANLPPGFDWPTDPEMEVELKAGMGLTYRFAPSWFIGGEVLYETEFETEVGQERWSVFAGPSLHYAERGWWATFTWMPQLVGGGETYPGQPSGLHLIEKTKEEFRLKVGFNF
jgi:hypothetical protein